MKTAFTFYPPDDIAINKRDSAGKLFKHPDLPETDGDCSILHKGDIIELNDGSEEWIFEVRDVRVRLSWETPVDGLTPFEDIRQWVVLQEYKQITNLNNHLYLTSSEASTELRIHPNTLHRWVKAGRVPCIRLGGRKMLFSRKEIENLSYKRLNK